MTETNLDPNTETLKEFVKKLNGRPFKASPNRNWILLGKPPIDGDYNSGRK